MWCVCVCLCLAGWLAVQESAFTLTCPVRAHFMEWAARGRHADVLDVKSGPRVSLAKHAAYKYLLHVRVGGRGSEV